jgi:hypothetical protein
MHVLLTIFFNTQQQEYEKVAKEIHFTVESSLHSENKRKRKKKKMYKNIE